MTTFELPPEPPVGSRVRDADGIEWTRPEHVGWERPVSHGRAYTSWAALLGGGKVTLIEPAVGSRIRDKRGDVWTRTGDRWECSVLSSPWSYLAEHNAPLTLIEANPWPTAPLIAAEGRLWFRQEDEDYLDKDGVVRGEGRNTFADPVVPVTVVPTAEWKNLRAERELGGCDMDTLMRLTEDIIAATDALGLDA